MINKFKQLSPATKEDVLNVALLTSFILGVISLKSIVKIFLMYSQFLEKIFN